MSDFYKVIGFTGNPVGGPTAPYSNMVPGPAWMATKANGDAKRLSTGGLAEFNAQLAANFPGYVAAYTPPPTSFLVEEWDPTALSVPLRLWLNTNRLSLIVPPLPPTGFRIEELPDDSGNNFDVTQVTTANQPEYRPALNGSINLETTGNIDPNSQWMTSADFTAAPICTLFSVIQFDGGMGPAPAPPPNLTASHIISDLSPPVPRLRISEVLPGPTYNYQVASGPVLNGSVYDTDPHILAVNYSPINVSLWLDGVLDASGILASVPGWYGLTLGSDPTASGNYSWNGLLGSQIIYGPGLLTDEERQTVIAYLSLLHGIPI